MNMENVVLWLECRHGDVCTTSIWRRQQFSVILQPTHYSDAASNHSHPALLSVRLVAELCPRFCSQLNSSHGCSAVTNLAWCVQDSAFKKDDSLAMLRSDVYVLRKDKNSPEIWRIKASNCCDVTIVGPIDLDSRVDRWVCGRLLRCV